MNLYELTAEVRALEAWLDENDGDVTGHEEAFDTAYLTATGDLKAKVDNYCGLIAEIEARQDARANEAARLLELVGIDKRKAARLKATLLECLQALGEKRLDCPRFRVTVCNNGGKQPVEVDEVPIDEVPEEYRVVRVSLDRGAVYDALTAGKALPFARLAERGCHVRIK